MAQPDFLGDGSVPRRTDAKWIIWAKILGKIQDALGGTALAANQPSRNDTARILKEKVLCAKKGVSYTG